MSKIGKVTPSIKRGSAWRELLLLAKFFRGASGLVDDLLDRIAGVGSRLLIVLATISESLVVGKHGDRFRCMSFDLFDFGSHGE